MEMDEVFMTAYSPKIVGLETEHIPNFNIEISNRNLSCLISTVGVYRKSYPAPTKPQKLGHIHSSVYCADPPPSRHTQHNSEHHNGLKRCLHILQDHQG